MENFYLPLSKYMKKSIKEDPTAFIEGTTQKIKKLGYYENFHHTVRMSSYTNRFRRWLNYIVSFFRPEPMTLSDLKEVKEYHKEHPLEFKYKGLGLIPEGAITLGFDKDNVSYSIEVFNKRIEVSALTSKEENEETKSAVYDLCETLLFDVLRK